MLRKDLGMASLSVGAPLEPTGTWNLEGGSYTGDFERWRALGTGHLSARVSMREGYFTGDPERHVKQGSEMGSASIGAPLLGNMEVCLSSGILIYRNFYEVFERDANAL